MLGKYKHLALAGLAIGAAACNYTSNRVQAACTKEQCTEAKNACNSGGSWNYNTDCAKWYACDAKSLEDCTNWGCTHADYRCRTGKEPFQP
jgi:hypothetical protein